MAKEVKQMLDITELLNTPLEQLVVRTRAKANDFGALSDEEKAQLHKKVAVNAKVAKNWSAGAQTAQFFVINDTPGEHTLSEVYTKGDKVSFTKNGESHVLPIKGFRQTGSRLKLEYEADGKKFSFIPAGMSIETEVGSVSISKATVVKE